MNTIIQNRLQIEKYLQLIVDATSVVMELASDDPKEALVSPSQQQIEREVLLVSKLASELSESEMEGLVTLKSRSLKPLSNKKKYMKNKIKVLLRKHRHNYFLRGISLHAR